MFRHLASFILVFLLIGSLFCFSGCGNTTQIESVESDYVLSQTEKKPTSDAPEIDKRYAPIASMADLDISYENDLFLLINVVHPRWTVA